MSTPATASSPPHLPSRRLRRTMCGAPLSVAALVDRYYFCFKEAHHGLHSPATSHVYCPVSAPRQIMISSVGSTALSRTWRIKRNLFRGRVKGQHMIVTKATFKLPLFVWIKLTVSGLRAFRHQPRFSHDRAAGYFYSRRKHSLYPGRVMFP